jgi:hypothetical protein
VPRQRARVRLRLSTPLEDVVRRVVADQAVAFWFERRGLFRTRPRVHVLLLPLRDVAVPGLDQEPVPGAGPDHWLVWQSLTGTGTPARLPTDAGVLARTLGLRSARGGDLAEQGLRALMKALYESRAM